MEALGRYDCGLLKLAPRELPLRGNQLSNIIPGSIAP